MNTRRVIQASTMLLLLTGIGCEVNRAQPLESNSTKTVSADEAVEIPGPYSIKPDGTVAYQSLPRPNGHLLGTRFSNGLTRDQVTQWIDRTARGMSGTRVYVRSIVGPYLLDPEEPASETNPKIYDVMIEVWEPRHNEFDHS
jgi:hypothetical protein